MKVTRYFIRNVGSVEPLRRGVTVEWCEEQAQAVEMAERLNAAEAVRHCPGPKVEPVKITIEPV